MPAKTKTTKKTQSRLNSLKDNDGDETTTANSSVTNTTNPTDDDEYARLRQLPPCYLRNDRAIQRLPASVPFSNITHIGSSFLRCCSSIKKIDLTPLRNVTYIGSSFMMGCVGLRAINLTPLSKVTHLGSDFLRKCKGLTRVDARPMKQLTSIPDGFLSRCSNLESVDIPLPKGTITTPHYLFWKWRYSRLLELVS